MTALSHGALGGVYGEFGEWKLGRGQFNNFLLFLTVYISACVKETVGIKYYNRHPLVLMVRLLKKRKSKQSFKENRV